MQWVLLVLQLVNQIALHVNIPLIRCTDYILRTTASPQTIAKAYWIYFRYIIVIFHQKNVYCLRFANKVEFKIGTRSITSFLPVGHFSSCFTIQSYTIDV